MVLEVASYDDGRSDKRGREADDKLGRAAQYFGMRKDRK